MLEQIRFIASIFSLIVEIVKQVEKSFPESGKGKDKLTLVKNILSDLDEKVLEYWPAIEKIISYTVSFCNVSGIFKK